MKSIETPDRSADLVVFRREEKVAFMT